MAGLTDTRIHHGCPSCGVLCGRATAACGRVPVVLYVPVTGVLLCCTNVGVAFILACAQQWSVRDRLRSAVSSVLTDCV